MHKILPVVLVLLLLSFFFTPLKTEVLYKIGLSGDKTVSCCLENEVVSSDGSFDESASTSIFNNQIIDYPKTSLAQGMDQPIFNPQVLGTKTASGEEKWIEVSIAQQKLRAWEGNSIVMEFPISSGKWTPTPKGTFYIWYKTRRQKMSGGSKELGTYFYLPNVPHNMFFYKGYAIHGAYWHNNFGQPMSHGCVNAPLGNAAQIFEWAGPVVPEGKNYIKADASNPGTKVFIH